MRRAVFVALTIAVVGGAGFYAYSTYTTWGPAIGAPPTRIDWCDRRYYPGSETMTLAQVTSEVDSSEHDSGGLREVARSPWGYAVMAAPMSAAQQSSHHTQVCAMVLYVKLAADSYLPYGLSGGP